jgi:hypothetical protein
MPCGLWLWVCRPCYYDTTVITISRAKNHLIFLKRVEKQNPITLDTNLTRILKALEEQANAQCDALTPKASFNHYGDDYDYISGNAAHRQHCEGASWQAILR